MRCLIPYGARAGLVQLVKVSADLNILQDI